MKKRNLILPLFLGSLFMPSTLDAAVFDLNKSNNNQKSELLIASPGGHGGEGGGGGMKILDKKEKDLNDAIKSYEFFVKKLAEAEDKGKSFEEIQKISNKIDKWYNKIKLLDPILFNEMFAEDVIDDDGVNNETLITDLKNLVTPKIVNVFNDVKNDIEKIPELLIENENGPYPLQPFSRCGILTEKALKAKENGNLKKADTYAKLSIATCVREKNTLEKQGRQIKEKSIDPKSLENIEFSLLGINSIIRDDYKNGSRYMKKAMESENQNTSNLKSLIAYTEIINGEIDQGCSDLEELIIDGTIDLVDLDIIPVEDICIKSRINK